MTQAYQASSNTEHSQLNQDCYGWIFGTGKRVLSLLRKKSTTVCVMTPWGDILDQPYFDG